MNVDKAHDDEDAKNISQQTGTDYSEKEETLKNSSTTSYEEPLKESLQTADTSVKKLKEISDTEEEAKKTNPKEGHQE